MRVDVVITQVVDTCMHTPAHASCVSVNAHTHTVRCLCAQYARDFYKYCVCVCVCVRVCVCLYVCLKLGARDFPRTPQEPLASIHVNMPVCEHIRYV
jgi:hypothetical protein